MRTQRIVNNIMAIIAWLASLVILAPLAFIVINSLKTFQEVAFMDFSLPAVPQWENFLIAFNEARVLRTMLNSLFISSTSALISLIVSAMAAFVLSRRTGKVSKRIYYYFLIGLLAPYNIVTTIRVLQATNMMGTYQGLIVLLSALLIPFSIFFMYAFMKTVPVEIDEAAVIDGANPIALFVYIILPVMMPIIVTIAMINFMNAWNDFMLPLYILGDSRRWPMVLGIFNFFSFHITRWQVIFANIILTLLPVFIVYVTCQKFIISGMVSGSIKG